AHSLERVRAHGAGGPGPQRRRPFGVRRYETMSDWVILVENDKDMPNAETPHKVINTRDYLQRPQLFEGTRPKLINLPRSYNYQSEGYYCSLLAEARGHRVLPSAENMLELSGKLLYAHAIPELED